MIMPKCSFCGKSIEHGTGLMFIERNGKIFYFDSKKCEKNMFKLGRDSRHFKWASKKK